MKKITLLLASLLLFAAAQAQTRVACIGNSITFGYLLKDPKTQSYPSQLQELLGDKYTVGNFGFSGATLMRHGHRPYFALDEFRQALAFKPDVALIHLGINDTDPRNWPELGREFAGDYMALIDSLRKVNPDVRIIVANLSPITPKHFRFRSGTRLWRDKIREVIPDIARKANVELIDFETPLLDRSDLIPDALHPTVEGAALMAKYAYGAITGNYGGLSLPEIYGSGMVLQRNRPLTIAGTADAGKTVTLTLDGLKYHATANNLGQWKVLTAPLATGGPYTMTVTDGSTTITLTDILAGEVWIAAGQSNMAFTLNESLNCRPTIDNCADPNLRIFDKHVIAATDAVEWPAEIVASVDSLRYYLPANWQAISPANAGRFSAVAYYFANELRKTMPDVPIGIISVAVGGSTLESWIDINTLQHEASESLQNWLTNDYHQKWVQGRARLNSGENHRHPYEPGYLFASAIRPMGPINIAGTIWYQGESNANNTDLFEKMFPVFADSWRRNFNSPELPILFVQLSSIDRASWPEFRDCQRRHALTIPNTAMAVSMDWGDSLNVHPINKQPIGQRLARQALNRVYGFDNVTPQGPTPRSVTSANGELIIEFDYADGLTSADGDSPRYFEIAEIDGFYLPADAKIIDNKIILKNMEIKNPRYVRYAWQPFTRANVVNSDSLPMSTFKAEADNAADFDVEEGLEFGVSAPYAGRIGDLIISAGGCNFPTADPFAPGATKKFYKGIYAASAADGMAWRRIGSLPQPAAYGATVALPADRLVLIGGTTAEGSLTGVDMLTIVDGRAQLSPLPALPKAIDNMAAAAIGEKIYVAGGNLDGAPSTALYMIDLSAPAPAWKTLKSIPGNPRVQPAMAAAVDASGETCLFLFGGFAPRFGKANPSLEVDGLKYSPAKNKWTALAAPTDAAGNSVSLGGGCAATLSNGKAAFAGGVNKKVFLDALTDQQPDYLSHPVSWYGFNPNVFVFNPATEAWEIILTSPDAARAGAAMVAGTDADIFIMGGELKPRVRSTETLHVK